MSPKAAGRGLSAAVALTVALLAPSSAAALAPPPLSVSAAALIEESTGQALYGLDPFRELPIASTTKIMTALVTLEHVHKLGIEYAQNDYYPAADDSQIGLRPGELMSVHDLLIALLLPSADDAAEDLAYNVGGGSIPRFIAMMNARAQQLGLTHTHYSTPIGLDTPGNYSSALNLVVLARYVLEHSAFFRRVVALPSAVLHTGPVGYVVNRNDLVGRVPWINGVKTGHTLDAGYVLVGSGTQHGMTLISAALGTSSESSRDANTLALLDWGFANFRLLRPIRAGRVMARPAVAYESGEHALVIAPTTYAHVFLRSQRVTVRVQAPTQLTGPIAAGARVGTAEVLADGRPVASIGLVLKDALPAVSPLTIAADFLARPATLVAAVLLLFAAFGTRLVWRQRARAAVAPR